MSAEEYHDERPPTAIAFAVLAAAVAVVAFVCGAFAVWVLERVISW